MRKLPIFLACAGSRLANALPCRAQPALTAIQDTPGAADDGGITRVPFAKVITAAGLGHWPFGGLFGRLLGEGGRRDGDQRLGMAGTAVAI
jgi:hypothetical protein